MDSQGNKEKGSRITFGDISDLVNPSEVNKVGLCEIYDCSEGLRNRDYKVSITISTENESYEELAPFREKEIPSRLRHIKLALTEKGFFVENARLHIIPYPHNTYIYTGTLYMAKNV